MIEKVKTFPNQAIPSVYGESLSYTQQVAYLTYIVNKCVDAINDMAAGGVPPFTETMEDWGLQIIGGEVAWTPTIKDLSTDMVNVKATIAAQGRKLDDIMDGIIELSIIQSQILTGEVQ